MGKYATVAASRGSDARLRPSVGGAPASVRSVSSLQPDLTVVAPISSPRPSGRAHLIAAADRAACGTDAPAFETAVRRLLPVVDDHLAIDLVAVIELAAHDVELATLRWTHLRRRL
jgi:hypothetical protein